jgi:hypothetical protein
MTITTDARFPRSRVEGLSVVSGRQSLFTYFS